MSIMVDLTKLKMDLHKNRPTLNHKIQKIKDIQIVTSSITTIILSAFQKTRGQSDLAKAASNYL